MLEISVFLPFWSQKSHMCQMYDILYTGSSNPIWWVKSCGNWIQFRGKMFMHTSRREGRVRGSWNQFFPSHGGRKNYSSTSFVLLEAAIHIHTKETLLDISRIWASFQMQAYCLKSSFKVEHSCIKLFMVIRPKCLNFYHEKSWCISTHSVIDIYVGESFAKSLAIKKMMRDLPSTKVAFV